jgi:hypothetical protein
MGWMVVRPVEGIALVICRKQYHSYQADACDTYLYHAMLQTRKLLRLVFQFEIPIEREEVNEDELC